MIHKEDKKKLKKFFKRVFKPKDGPFESYYLNGNLKERGDYKNRKKEGPWETFNKNGELKTRETFFNGNLTGKENYKDGKKSGLEILIYGYRNNPSRLPEPPQYDFLTYGYGGKSSTNYKNGLKHGLYEFFSSDGTLLTSGNYKDDQKEGLWECIDEQSLGVEKGKSSTNYKNGSKHGLDSFFKDGILSVSCNYQNGHLIYREFFYSGGELKERTNYKNGLKHGLYELFSSDGTLLTSGNYKDDQKEGLWEYDSAVSFNGIEIKTREYKNGKITKEGRVVVYPPVDPN
jgi:uncharacterized protein